jgi:hypothetical protein
VSDRVSEVILLCEDDEQERLVRAYLKRCGLRTLPPSLRPINASRQVHGGNVTWVLNAFPKELEACRKRHAAHAKTLLIVVVDADDLPVTERRSQLNNPNEVSVSDPVVVLIPKRHVETWIRAANNHVVNEIDDYKKPAPKKEEIREAANQIYGWARDNPKPGPTCVDSLRVSLPEWRKIQ